MSTLNDYAVVQTVCSMLMLTQLAKEFADGLSRSWRSSSFMNHLQSSMSYVIDYKIS